MRHLNKFNTISEYTTAEPTLSMPNLSLIMEDNTVRTVKDDEIVFIEYLQSTGTQYIDTNIAGNTITRFIVDGTCIHGSSTNKQLLGEKQMDNNTFFGGHYTGAWFCLNGSTFIGNNANRTLIDATLGTTNSGTLFDKVTNTIQNFNSIVSSSWGFTASNLLLFGGHDQRKSASSKCYSLKLYQNNVLVLDFVPVRVGAVGYMYDTVSKKLFANAGTGNFTLGPDITAVEYLQSDGNQYIDTGIIPNISTGIKISYMKQSTSTDRSEAIFGLQNVQNTYTCWYAIAVKGSTSDPNYIRFGRQTYWSVGAHKAPYDVINTISLNYFNNRKSTTSNPSMTFDFSGAGSYNFNYDPMFTALYDIRLFGLNGYKSYQNLIGRIYSCTISQGNKIIMDMIPVRIGTEGYMFDKVSRRFFRNNGTGNFTYGADVTGVDLVNRKEYIKF